MGFKELLNEKLNGMSNLPNGYQKIGDIIVVNLDKEIKNKEEIGKAILEIFKVRTVCNKFGEIKGKFREPQIEVIAGDKNTVTTHIENGCKYRFDIRKVMFAKGNINERVRIAKQVRKGEVIVDMFAGLGYFSVPIGKLSKPERIYSIELNPVSFNFLKENLKINHIHNAVIFNEDNREVIDKLVEQGVKADRVIMGYLPPPKEFLDSCFKIVKKNSIVHYEDLVVVGKEKKDIDRVVSEVEGAGKKAGFNTELLLAKKVKGYGPKIDHYVFDFKIS